MALEVFKLFDSWMLYRPADGYDAMLLVTPGDSKVTNVLFSPAGSVTSCPEGTVSSDVAQARKPA